MPVENPEVGQHIEFECQSDARRWIVADIDKKRGEVTLLSEQRFEQTLPLAVLQFCKVVGPGPTEPDEPCCGRCGSTSLNCCDVEEDSSPVDTGTHFVSASCRGEKCQFVDPLSDFQSLDPNAPLPRCRMPASHKVAEEIFGDDPNPIRHGLSSYLCCRHYRLVMGGTCEKEIQRGRAESN